jgi:hypothetical protein
MDQGKSDCEALLAEFLPFAEKMLKDCGEFLPFGGRMNPDGITVWEGASNGEENPRSTDLIEILRSAHKDLAMRQNIRAAVIVYDVRIVPPKCITKQDAIAIELDHKLGYSAIVYYPYVLSDDLELALEPPFKHRSENATFSGCSPNTSLERTREG